MAANNGNTFFTVIFTTIVAPITVSLAVKKMDEEGKAGQDTTSNSALTIAAPPTTITITAEGAGSTPEDALRLALGTALHKVLSSTVPLNTANRDLVIDSMIRDGQRLIASYQDVRSFDSWKGWKRVHHRVVSVTILQNRLNETVRAVLTSSRPSNGLSQRGI